MPQSSHSGIRRSARVIRMVGELHRMGYQRLRIMPYQYALGTYRVLIAPAHTFDANNGAYSPNAYEGLHAAYSSVDEDQYFGWNDTRGNSARQLADKFVNRFSELCRRGEGRDWEYAGWLAELESVLERLPSRLPILMAEDIDTQPERMTFLILRQYGSTTLPDDIGDRQFPLPPSGS